MNCLCLITQFGPGGITDQKETAFKRSPDSTLHTFLQSLSAPSASRAGCRAEDPARNL